MTIEVLEYMHKLIKHEVEIKHRVYKEYEALVDRQELKEEVTWNTKDSEVSDRLQELRRLRTIAYDHYSLARRALDQIESKSWD